MIKKILVKGFTLIELIVVIIILAVLVAIAFPKYLDLIKNAERAAVQGVVGGYAAAVNVAAANYKLQSNRDQSGKLLSGVNPDTWFNENDWPVGATDGTISVTAEVAITNTLLLPAALQTSCANLFNNLLSTSSVRTDPNCQAGGAFEYCVSSQSNHTQCVYAYVKDPIYGITYTPFQGTVALLQGQNLITGVSATFNGITTGTTMTGTNTSTETTAGAETNATTSTSIGITTGTGTSNSGTTNTSGVVAPTLTTPSPMTGTSGSASTVGSGVVVTPSGVVVTPSGVVVTPQGVVITPSGTIVNPAPIKTPSGESNASTPTK